MSYLDEARLSAYDNSLKEWISSQESKTITSSIYPWTKTAKAGTVSCYPVGGTELKPVVDFMFTETLPASGDKGPDNPSAITGVSSVKVTRAGKNLFVPADLVSQVGTTITIAGVTLTVLPDFAYSLTGTATADALFYLRYNGGNQGLPVKSDAIYTFSGCPSGGSASTYYMAWHPAIGGNVYDYGSGVTVVHPSTDATHYTFNCQIMVKAGTTVTNLVFKPQMELGSVKTEYEVPEVTDYPLPLGSTYYGGEIDLATGLMTVTFAGRVFDGTEEWGFVNSDTYYCYRLNISSPAPSGSALSPVYNTEKCTHFDVQNNTNMNSQHIIAYGNRIDVFTTQTTLSAFKQWLADESSAGHPVSMAYPLAAPITVQLSPTQILSLTQTDKYTPRLNTVYSNAQAVQVGYVKSPIRDEYELTQAIASQGGEI